MTQNNHVYYVCYGSNLYADRFREYLETHRWGSALDSFDAYGNYDSEVISYRVNLSHDVYYAGHSGRWGGGIAYLDTEGYSCKKVYRAYKLDLDQFEDLFSQENGYHSDPLPWDRIMSRRETRTSAYFYGRIVNFGTVEGIPAVTFTSNYSLEELKSPDFNGYKELSTPGPLYTEVINKGREETRRLPFKEIAPL